MSCNSCSLVYMSSELDYVTNLAMRHIWDIIIFDELPDTSHSEIRDIIKL